ncbi:MAG: hypothetical protein KME35_23905 [Aphanocapsa sp. GSE-SYN-MK-11-07L]|jgi:hypothetical protein|nr:hypothetical protein [Aphanocapsa sp. GSE-SYN-MK-11-07L]
MEIPIQQDEAFLKALYQRYKYLQDYPCDFRGTLIDEAVSLGLIQSDDFLGALLGYPVEDVSLTLDYFSYLPAEVNRKLAHYRHLSPVQPWPQPIIGMAMAGDRGKVTGTHSIPVVLKNMGNAQLWYGQDCGFIFEAFLEGSIQKHREFEVLINQLWSLCEGFLKRQGITTLYTLARDPAFEEKWFYGHLERRGYQPIAPRSVVWCQS